MYEQLFVNYETRVMKRDLPETERYLKSLREVSRFLYAACPNAKTHLCSLNNS